MVVVDLGKMGARLSYLLDIPLDKITLSVRRVNVHAEDAFSFSFDPPKPICRSQLP